MRIAILALLMFVSVAAHAEIQISVRGENVYVIGTNCDPEIVIRTPFRNVGIVDARCEHVQFLPQAPAVIESDGEITVTIGNPLNEFFENCQLISTQRNHYVKGEVFEAWSFECRTGAK